MKKIVIGNLKMNILSRLERKKYLDWFKKEWQKNKIKEMEVVLAPAFIHLENFKKELPKGVFLGAQNCFWEESGSYTGEISPLMLKDLGLTHIILGHSERRRFFMENDEEIGLKIAKVLNLGLTAVFCVGESKTERENGIFFKVIEQQLRRSLRDIKRTLLKNLIIAYEPIWSIGTKEIPTSNEIMEAKVLIKKILVEIFGKKYGELPRIIYGGNVNSRTAEEACVKSEMDGALIGRDSLLPSEFLKIIKIINSSC
jgi:triosephosphate isomerase